VVEGAEGHEGIWEVNDVDIPLARLPAEHVLGLACQGRLGFHSQVRRPGEPTWTRAIQRPEFGYGFPHLNWLRTNPKAEEVAGVAVVSPDLGRTLYFARKAASNPEVGKLGFWFAAHVPWAAAPLRRNARLFQMWYGFYLAPIVESAIVKPGGWVNVYMAAFNATDKPQQHAVVATDTAVSVEAERNLMFALGPWKWTVQGVSFPADPSPGWHQIGFHSASAEARGATALAVGVLTLGSLIYVPGIKSFVLQYGVLTPENAKTVTTWEADAMDAAARHFSDHGADSIVTAKGERVPKEVVLKGFGKYLVPGRVVKAIEDKERKPEESMDHLLAAFLFDSFGVTSLDKAFPVT